MTRPRLRTLLPLLVAGGAAACNHGMQPKTFIPAISPAGAVVWVRLPGDRADRTGELYAVDSAGAIVLSGRLTRFPWHRLERLDVVGLGAEFDAGPSTASDPDRRARLALVSRFPQGLDGDLLRRVLATLGQASVDEPDAPRRATPDLDALAEAAAGASARFADRRLAIAAGYRRIGTDFPAMGEHWLLTGAILHAEVDPARPTMLTYVTVDGHRCSSAPGT
jgi:hypothetical protein